MSLLFEKRLHLSCGGVIAKEEIMIKGKWEEEGRGLLGREACVQQHFGGTQHHVANLRVLARGVGGLSSLFRSPLSSDTCDLTLS